HQDAGRRMREGLPLLRSRVLQIEDRELVALAFQTELQLRALAAHPSIGWGPEELEMVLQRVYERILDYRWYFLRRLQVDVVDYNFDPYAQEVKRFWPIGQLNRSVVEFLGLSHSTTVILVDKPRRTPEEPEEVLVAERFPRFIDKTEVEPIEGGR